MDELALDEPDLSPGPDSAVLMDAGFEQFFREHEARVGRYLVQITHDRGLADDLLRETFMAAYAALPPGSLYATPPVPPSVIGTFGRSAHSIVGLRASCARPVRSGPPCRRPTVRAF